MAMPGEGVMRRVILIKVWLAVVFLGVCLPLPAGADNGALPGIFQLYPSPAPSLAAQWSPPRKSQYTSDTTPSRTPVYPQRRFHGLLKFMAGGLLGGVLCSFLFGYPLSLYWSQGNWPVGFLDVVVITTAAYLGYRLLRPLRPKGGAVPIPGFHMPEDLAPAVFTIKNEAGPGLARFSHTSSAFNLAVFVEYARQTVFDLHDAWNHEDLDKIKDRVTSQMLEFLGMGLKILSFRGEISRVEDLALSQIVVLMARQEEGRDIITMGFQGRVVDYLLERRSFKLISGSMTYPERLQECWIFEREWGRRSWLLTDILDSRFFVETQAA
ncbi:MAG: TIM44-like domain-containing protein [Deltaproteobacteria bacterium]|nr:TIM44-like domain-containing protein [Deltaproteobacteria bacterium]MBI4795342.1 TIM44-like domain-containing protein [Deltaproteobacteria bacterium]